MQTFSHMQRNSTDQISVKEFFWALVGIGYALVIPMSIFFPPLIGVFFSRFYLSPSRKFAFFLAIYAIIFEIDHAFILFSLCLYLFFLYTYIMPYFEQKIVCQSCYGIVGIVSVYGGYSFFILFLSSLLGLEAHPWSWTLLAYYILVEIILDFITKKN